MFNVELNDDGVDLMRELFQATPVMVFSRWIDYTGTCVWRCNQYSTYSLPGEPQDAQWGDLFAAGVFDSGVVRKLWARLEECNPDEYERRIGASRCRIDFDRETKWGQAAALTGGVAKKDERGDWTIERPKVKRKKVLGIF